jgi:hypothetical protein
MTSVRPVLVCCRYEGLKVGSKGKLNSGFWGQECGPEIDETPGRLHKYMEDAISVNTGWLPVCNVCAAAVVFVRVPGRTLTCTNILSFESDLEDTHFQRHHVYTLEWQPGKDGYLYW